MAKRKVKVSKERQVNTYAEFRHASRVILSEAEEGQAGSFYQVMASLIFTAFMMEAYLNHVGTGIFECWHDLARLPPSAKLNLIAEKLGVKKDEGRRPYQTISEVFKFRNTLAHGKSVSLKSNDEIRLVDETFDRYSHEFLETEWEKYCTLDNANRALEDMEAIITEIHKSAGNTDFPFFLGMQGTLSTLLPEEQAQNNST